MKTINQLENTCFSLYSLNIQNILMTEKSQEYKKHELLCTCRHCSTSFKLLEDCKALGKSKDWFVPKAVMTLGCRRTILSCFPKRKKL